MNPAVQPPRMRLKWHSTTVRLQFEKVVNDPEFIKRYEEWKAAREGKSLMKRHSNPSEWKVCVASIVGVTTLYQAYRLIDKNKPDEPDNRETCGGHYKNIIDAERLARTLNEERGS